MRVRISEISKKYGMTSALDGVDLESNNNVSVLGQLNKTRA